MDTFVPREILDGSITGEKISGGTVNWIDGLYTDALYVPHSGSAGVGAIDGAGFKIGFNEKLNYISAENILAEYLLMVDPNGGFAGYLDVSGSDPYYGLLSLRYDGSNKIYLNSNSSALSYYVPKIVFGKKTALSIFYQMEINGYLYADNFAGSGINVGTVTATNRLEFYDHDTVFTEIDEVTVSVETVSSFFLEALYIGQKYHSGGMAEPWLSLSLIPANSAVQLATMGLSTTISEGQWDILGNLDIDLSSSDSPFFASLGVGSGGSYFHGDTLASIDGTQFERLAYIDQNVGASDEVEFSKITIGGGQQVGRILMNEPSVMAEFDWIWASGGPADSTNFGDVGIGWVIIGNLVTIFVRSESEGYHTTWTTPPGPQNLLLFDRAGGTGSYDGHFEIPLDRPAGTFDDIPAPWGGLKNMSSVPVLFQNQSNFNKVALYAGLQSVAYMDSNRTIHVKPPPASPGITASAGWNEHPAANDPVVNDFEGVEAGDILFVPHSFSITYYAAD